MNVGPQVRALREQRGLTQEMLAAKVGAHQAHVANIENGVKTPSLRLLILLAEALGVSVHELVSDAESTPTASA